MVSGVGYKTSVTSLTNVGTYGVTATGGTAQNYTIVDAAGNLVVTPAQLTVTANGSQVYGATSPSVSFSYNGLKNGQQGSVVSGLGYTTSVTSATNVGTYGVTATGGTAQNYTIVDAAGNLVVTPAPLTITPTGTQTYGGTPTVSYGYTGLQNGQTGTVVTGLGYTTPATSGSNVGTYGITATGGSSPNYTITDGSGVLTVNPASLLITANDTDKVQGSANPVFTASFQGLVLGQTSSVVTGLLINSPATQSSPIGNYSINPSNGSAQNYTLTYAPGILSVVAAPVTPTQSGTPTPIAAATAPQAVTPFNAGSQGNLIPLPETSPTQAVLAAAIPSSVLNQVNQIDCLKVNLEIRGVTTDSPIDCSTPLEVNGF